MDDGPGNLVPYPHTQTVAGGGAVKRSLVHQTYSGRQSRRRTTTGIIRTAHLVGRAVDQT